MTPQEQELLASLTQKINQTQLQEKDPEAEDFLRRELGSNPDALYMLAQTVLVQNIALDQAKAQIGQMQQQLQEAQSRPQPAHTTSFLGRLLGDKDPQPAPPPPPSQSAWGGQQAPPYQPVPQFSQPQYAPPPPPYQQPQYVPVSGGQPSFMRGAMQTAAGVAAGALAFEGIESILHGFGHPGGYGMAGMGMAPGMGLGGGFERPVEETVINNYYDEPGTRGFEHDRPEGEHHHEASNFADSNDDSDSRDGTEDDDDSGSYDDSGSDDSSGFDDGGDDGGSGFDDGGGSDLS